MDKNSKAYENIFEVSKMYVDHVANFRLTESAEDELMGIILGRTLSSFEETFDLNIDWDGIRYRIDKKVAELKGAA